MGRRKALYISKCLSALLLTVLFLLTVESQAQDSIHRGQGFAAPDTVITEPVEQPVEAIEEYDDEEAVEGEEDEPIHFLPYTEGAAQQERNNFQLRATSDSQLKQWKSSDDFWYADRAFNAKAKEVDTRRAGRRSFWGSRLFQTILLMLAIMAFVSLLVLFLSQNSAMVLRRSRNIVRDNPDVDTIPDNIFAIEYDREIGRAEQQANYRLAIRLRFLRLLKQLSERQIIQYLDERTNLDYLMQLQQSPWYNDFFRLMRHYEFSWYGLFDVSESQYGRIKSDFEQVNKKFY